MPAVISIEPNKMRAMFFDFPLLVFIFFVSVLNEIAENNADCKKLLDVKKMRQKQKRVQCKIKLFRFL